MLTCCGAVSLEVLYCTLIKCTANLSCTVLVLSELALFTCVLCTVHAADSPPHKEEEFVPLYVLHFQGLTV